MVGHIGLEPARFIQMFTTNEKRPMETMGRFREDAGAGFEPTTFGL